MSAMQQNHDGSWSKAEPLGWQGQGIDWEVYRPGDRECRRLNVRWMARGYDEDVLVAEVYARTSWGLRRKAARIARGGAR